MSDPDTVIHLRNARRQILHALQTGREHDLYGAICQLLGHYCHLASKKNSGKVAFYCDPQGVVSFVTQLTLSALNSLQDPDYNPSVGEDSERDADEEDGGVESNDETVLDDTRLEGAVPQDDGGVVDGHDNALPDGGQHGHHVFDAPIVAAAEGG